MLALVLDCGDCCPPHEVASRDRRPSTATVCASQRYPLLLHELHPAVLASALRRVVVVERFGRAETGAGEPGGVHLELSDQNGSDGFGAAPGEVQVLVGATRFRMADHSPSHQGNASAEIYRLTGLGAYLRTPAWRKSPLRYRWKYQGRRLDEFIPSRGCRSAS